ncbi:MAG TPA: DUF5610 domain-containing protein [Dongiaceae bacterium]|nr:DUF5610 domain-containing protein [Dongiaceae bacterium]
MVSFNPLFQRDFFNGMQGARNGAGHQCQGRGQQQGVGGQTVTVESVQSTLTVAYERMQSVVQSRLQTVGETSTTTPAANDDQDYSSQAVADRIVGFIAKRLEQEKANGATDEELMSLYQQGLKGVEKGLREGRDIIADQGKFDGDVKSTFYDTVNKIADGLEQLGKQYFGDDFQNGTKPTVPTNPTNPTNPTTPTIPTTPTKPTKPSNPTTPTTGTGFKAGLTQMQMERSRSFEMEVVTKEGDKVKIMVNSGQAFAGQRVNYEDDANSIEGFEGTFSSYDNLSFSVEGDLNEEELAALNDLFGQVNDVADTFYGGDVEAAFDQAMEVGMDPEQLASFAVNMNQTETVAVRSTYVAVQNMTGPALANPYEDLFKSLGEFADQVKQSSDALANLENAPANMQSLFTDLLSRLHSGYGDEESHANDFSRFLEQINA